MNNDRYFIKKYTSLLCMIFLIIQPILDIWYLYIDEVVTTIGFSPSTIIRIGITFLLFILTYIYTDLNRHKLCLCIYGLFVILYSIIHHINTLSFISLVPGNFNYSLMQELFYIIRLLIPILLIMVIYFQNISSNNFYKVVSILIFIICGTIVITNILKISLSSFTNQPIKNNIFSWFFDAYKVYSHLDLSSKGFFYNSAQIGTVLVMLLPINIYFFIKRTNMLNTTCLVIQTLSMLMLGNKIAAYGLICVMLAMVLIYLFFVIVKKDINFKYKTIVCFLFLFVTAIMILQKSPAVYREQIANRVEKLYKDNNASLLSSPSFIKSDDVKFSNNQETDSSISRPELSIKNNCISRIYNVSDKDLDTLSHNKNEIIKFIEENYKKLWIYEMFIKKSYPYQYDPDFWYEILHEPIHNRLNYRYLEEKMIKRVKEINNNNLDDWFGIGFSRVSNIFNVERDFINQYYSMGIIGVILFFGPFIFILLLGIYKCLRYYKNKFNLENIILLFAVLLALIASFYSGNSLDGLFVTIIMSFICGCLLKNVTKYKEGELQ